MTGEDIEEREILTSKTTIIAEAGVNHNGDIGLAKRLIDEASEVGVDFIKFQTWVTEDVLVPDAPKAEYQIVNDGNSSQFEMAKRLELPFAAFVELRDHCHMRNVSFLSTPEEQKSLDFLADELRLPMLKIGSPDLTNLPFLRLVARKKLRVLLSTGMGSLAEVENAYHTLVSNGAPDVTLLHCTSNYPAAFDSVNLRAILTLKQAFNTSVGYSDHTTGTEAALAAVVLGATVIEKHFTLDKTLPGPDHRASIDPGELRLLVSQIRNVEAALGDGRKVPHPSEREARRVVRKGIYVTRDLKAGDRIRESDILGKRPAQGIDIEQVDLIVGKRVRCDLQANHPLSLSEIDFAS